MVENGLRSISVAARELRVARGTISDLISTLGLTPKPMSNGKAKGLDDLDMKALRRALGPNRRASKPAASVA